MNKNKQQLLDWFKFVLICCFTLKITINYVLSLLFYALLYIHISSLLFFFFWFSQYNHIHSTYSQRYKKDDIQLTQKLYIWKLSLPNWYGLESIGCLLNNEVTSRSSESKNDLPNSQNVHGIRFIFTIICGFPCWFFSKVTKKKKLLAVRT